MCNTKANKDIFGNDDYIVVKPETGVTKVYNKIYKSKLALKNGKALQTTFKAEHDFAETVKRVFIALRGLISDMDAYVAKYDDTGYHSCEKVAITEEEFDKLDNSLYWPNSKGDKDLVRAVVFNPRVSAFEHDTIFEVIVERNDASVSFITRTIKDIKAKGEDFNARYEKSKKEYDELLWDYAHEKGDADEPYC